MASPNGTAADGTGGEGTRTTPAEEAGRPDGEADPIGETLAEQAGREGDGPR